MKHTVALTLLITSALAGQAQAAIKFPSFSDTGYNAKVTAKDREAPKTSRKPSADQIIGENDLPEDFRKAGGFRDKFLKINAAEGRETGLAEFLDQAEKDYKSYSPDVKFFIAQLETIRPLRSIVFRMRKLSEKNKTIEASAVVMMKSIASMIKIYLPTEQWQAGWDYVTLPTRDVKIADQVNHQFESMRELQDWASGDKEGELAKSLTDASKRISEIYDDRVNHPGQKALVLDNRLSYGTGTFPDGLDRFRTFDNPEILSARATLQISLHSIKVFAAYNQEQFFDYFAEVGRQAGFGQILNPDADVGLSALDRCKILNESENLVQRARDRLSANCNQNTGGRRKYGEFLRIRPNGAALMASAGEHLAGAVDDLNTAWADMQPLSESGYAWIDPGKVKPSKREIDLRLKTMLALVKGPAQIKSALTGDRVCVDLPKVFSKAPADLKDYFATGFKTDVRSEETITVNRQSYNFRHYDHGRATQWNPAKWSEYVKVVATNGPDDCGSNVGPQTPASMGDALRILRQSWGGDYVSPVIDFLIR